MATTEKWTNSKDPSSRRVSNDCRGALWTFKRFLLALDLDWRMEMECYTVPICFPLKKMLFFNKKKVKNSALHETVLVVGN